MSLLIKQRRFEEAAQSGLRALTGRPSDAKIYYLISLSYIERARYEPETRESSLRLVDEYWRKSLSLDPEDQLNRFNIAWVLEQAGDIESNSRCRYYRDSVDVLKQTAGNQSSDVVLKEHVATSLSRAIQKLKTANCATPS